MAYKIIHEKYTKHYKVVNATTGKVHSFGTTKEKADAQVRLLNAVEHGAQLKERNKASLKNIRYK